MHQQSGVMFYPDAAAARSLDGRVGLDTQLALLAAHTAAHSWLHTSLTALGGQVGVAGKLAVQAKAPLRVRIRVRVGVGVGGRVMLKVGVRVRVRVRTVSVDGAACDAPSLYLERPCGALTLT